MSGRRNHKRVELGPPLDGGFAPDDEALAAIVAALEAVFAESSEDGGAPHPGWRTRPAPAWRFSGRWWAGPPALHRDRPDR